jgi:hypothetical protein
VAGGGPGFGFVCHSEQGWFELVRACEYYLIPLA